MSNIIKLDLASYLGEDIHIFDDRDRVYRFDEFHNAEAYLRAKNNPDRIVFGVRGIGDYLDAYISYKTNSRERLIRKLERKNKVPIFTLNKHFHAIRYTDDNGINQYDELAAALIEKVRKGETQGQQPSPEVTIPPEDAWKECAYCKAKGHLIKECMAFYDPPRCELQQAKSRRPAENRSDTECRYCHKNTHRIKECPRLTRKIREKKERESRENAAQKLQESVSSIGYTMVVHR